MVYTSFSAASYYSLGLHVLILGCSYCLSLLSGSPLLLFAYPLASLVCGSLYHALVALASPLFSSPSTFSLPSGSGAVAPFFLLRIFLSALSSGALYIGALAPLRLSVLLLLPFLFTLYMSFGFASASLLSGYSGIFARVSSTFTLSRRFNSAISAIASWLLFSH